MGKKGVLLDNGKVAQSSMALYWKAGQKKGGHQADAPHEEKEEDM
jgi:predicted heme/steroid binding protein